jgi:hypothetical protein
MPIWIRAFATSNARHPFHNGIDVIDKEPLDGNSDQPNCSLV